MCHERFPEHKRAHLRIRLVVQEQVQRVLQRLFLPAVIDKQKRGRCPSVQLILARVLHDLRLAEKRRAALRLKAQHQAKLFPLRIVEKLRALRVNDLPAAGKAHRRQGSCQHRCQ